jgi:hypothetical protein
MDEQPSPATNTDNATRSAFTALKFLGQNLMTTGQPPTSLIYSIIRSGCLFIEIREKSCVLPGKTGEGFHQVRGSPVIKSL